MTPTRQSETTEADGASGPHERPVASPGPRSGLVWTAIIAHAAVAGLTQVLWLSYAPIATQVAEHYDVSVGAVGWLTNVFPLLYVVLAIPAGLALDRWPRRTMGFGAALVVAGAVVRYAWDDFAGGLLGQILVSIAQPIALGGVAVIAASLLPASRRAVGIAVGSGGVFAGLLVGIAMPTAFGAEHLGALLGVQAALSIAGAAVLVAALRGLGQRAMATSDAEVAPGFGALRDLIADPVQRTLLTLAAGGFGAFVALLTWLQALLEPRGISEDTSGLLLLALVLAGFVGTAFLPALVARRGLEARLLLVALPIATVAAVVLAAGPGVAITAIALGVIGAALLPALPVMLELAEQRADTSQGRTGGGGSGAASALLWLSGNLGGFAAALVVGATLDQPAIGFGLIALLTLVTGATAGRRLQRS